MSKIKYNISLDMHSLVSQASLAAKQGDDNRQFAITLRSGGQPYKIERGAFAVFSTTLPDGKVIEDNCIIANDEIVYDFTQNLTSQIGVLDIEIRLYDANSKLITSPTFILVVSPRAAKAEDITSSNSFTALDNLYKDTSEAIQRADDAANFAISTARSIEEARDNGDFNGEDGEDVNYNLVSNALKGRASGNHLIIDDVSPVEHKISCHLTSDNIFDFSSVKVSRYGKNLYDVPTEISVSKTYNGILVTDTNSKWYGQVNIDALPEIFTISTTIICDNPGTDHTADTSLRLYFYDSNKVELPKLQSGSRVTVDNPKSVLTFNKSQLPEGAQYIGLMIRLNSAGYTENTQIELGTTTTEYAPYIKPATYLANADGTVEVTSLYPTTTLICDKENVVLDVEYNRDANKVIDELYSLVQGSSASRISYIDLPSANWKGTASPYSQVVAIDGITDFSKVDINPSIEQLAIFHAKDIAFVAENEDGVVTVYCIGQKPTANYTMQITITEVLTNG